jgi:hypothetical protein
MDVWAQDKQLEEEKGVSVMEIIVLIAFALVLNAAAQIMLEARK